MVDLQKRLIKAKTVSSEPGYEKPCFSKQRQCKSAMSDQPDGELSCDFLPGSACILYLIQVSVCVFFVFIHTYCFII